MIVTNLNQPMVVENIRLPPTPFKSLFRYHYKAQI